MKDRWTAEEYRRYLETGKDPERQRTVDERYAKAEREGKVMVLDIGPAEQPEKKRKYRNEPITVDGIRFDSKHEARVYESLMERVKTGELKCVCRQVKFDLPGGIRYIADFVTIAPDNSVEVIDAKSDITRKNRVYINKKKQMKACWGLEVKEA